MNKNLFINPVIAKITSKFGKRIAPKPGASTYHSGVDLATPLGTDILCPADGVVGMVGNDSLNGNYLKVVHDNGYITGYAHLNKVLVKKGDKVYQNDLLAETGKSGMATGPCLHFTLRQGKNMNSPTIDPLLYFDFAS